MMSRERSAGPILAALLLWGVPAGAVPDFTPIVPPGTEAADASLQGRVLRALAEDEKVRGLEVSAEVRAGRAVLRGRVANLQDRDNAVLAAARVRGLLDLRDELEIAPRPGGDGALRTTLESALAAELRSVRLGVEVKDGRVVLTGLVSNTTQRAAARNRVLRVEGVRGLRNDILVQSEQGLDDARMRLRLVELIENRRLYPLEGEITVQVRDRRVTLAGVVPRVFDKLIAEKVAGIISGVRELKNEIEVIPSTGTDVRQVLPLPPP